MIEKESNKAHSQEEKIIIISKINCSRCRNLKDFFIIHGIPYEEWRIEDKMAISKLLSNQEFIKKFYIKKNNYQLPEHLNILTPILYLPEEEKGEKFHANDLFGINGLRKNYLIRILDLNEEIVKNKDDSILEEKLYCTNDLVQKFLEKYVLAIGICRTSGDLLYYFRVDKEIKIDLISQFIAALSMFGEESLGSIERVFIRGLDIEMSFVSKYDLIFVVLFRKGMVEDYLEEESAYGLEQFYQKFEKYIEAGKSNQNLYQSFDLEMCYLIQKFLVRIGILECIDCSLDIPLLRERSNNSI